MFDVMNFSIFVLPVQKRQVLEETNQLESRVSALDDDLEDMETSDEEEDGERRVFIIKSYCMHFKCLSAL